VQPINDDISVRFWGVRGSVPSPGPTTARYGGNTSCVTVEGINAADGRRRIGVFDAGTGIRALGKTLIDRDVEIILLLTHAHWDHIQGFPYFDPIYQAKRSIYFSSLDQQHTLFRRLLEQMDGTHFPLTQAQLRAHLDTYSPLQLQQYVAEGYSVSRIKVNHPGETYGFRADLRGRSVVYIPDNEIDPPYPPVVTTRSLSAICRNADVQIHDAQYLESDLPAKSGWGHSLISRVWRLARAARVGHVVLFHHDPDRSDDELDAIQAASNRWFAEHAPQIRCTVAYEGLEIRLPPAA
jgi:phosphoribosyl 1,2-cyclic phosphodiesterase